MAVVAHDGGNLCLHPISHWQWCDFADALSPSPGKGAFQVRLILPLGPLNEEDTGVEPLLASKVVCLKGIMFYRQQGC